MSIQRPRRRHLRPAPAFILVLAAVAPARAWDSVEEAKIRSFPRTDPGVIELPPHLLQKRAFSMRFLKDAIGGDASGARDALTKLIRCPPDVLLARELGGGSLLQCQQATTEDLRRTKAEWLTARVSGDVEHQSEHTLIARAAAGRAGLLHDGLRGQGPHIFETFWVRYPALNALVGSGVGPDPDADTETDPPNVTPEAYVFGQSFRPVDLTEPDASFVTRSISLLELAQLPDFSNSLADWAMGNETCPIPGAEQAYKNVHATEACHRFKNVMGAVNVTHFKPLNREMWRHYHRLALNKMDECAELASIPSEFYAAWEDDFLLTEPKVFSDANTEVHECERLAMAYEMFGQHFIQDAWSSGHMWMRWGHPRFTDFPADVRLTEDDMSLDYPARNHQPRQALIAAMTGVTAGMIHGAKSVVLDIAREKRWDSVLELEQFGFFDDPLNGGTHNGKDVLWLDGLGGGGRQPGAGDLFWDPAIVTGAAVQRQETFALQRERLLNCSAASMLDVYRRSGPRAHGSELEVYQGLSTVSPDSEQCWGQWVTNDAMLGALGPLDASYLLSNLSSAAVILNYVSDIVVNREVTQDLFASVIDFPAENQVPQNDMERELAEDRDLIKKRLVDGMYVDLRHIRAVYAVNGVARPAGIESAQQLRIGHPNERITLLGVPPVEPTSTPSSEPQNVDYVDRNVEGSAQLNEAEQALSRMFWRGDLQQTCRSLEHDSSRLYALKSECVQGAALGGDSESCTACVALAELHIPRCSRDLQGSVSSSKCSAAGAPIASGLPMWWFNNFARRVSWDDLPEPFTGQSTCGPSVHLALEWCTDTPNEEDLPGSFRRRYLGSYSQTDAVNCSPPSFDPVFVGKRTWEERVARLLIESPPAQQQWLFPMATAYDYAYTWIPGTDPCDPFGGRSETSRDGLISANVSPASLLEYIGGISTATAAVPRCGVTQRTFHWNRECSEARTVLASTLPKTPLDMDTFYPDTGTLLRESRITPEVAYCYVREPRRYLGECPGGFECTAGGECVTAPRARPAFTSLSHFPLNQSVGD